MKMVGWLMKNAILLIMKNNFYTFNNQIRKQCKGGAIGNKLRERLGKIFMKRFDTKYLKLCVELGIKHELYGRYVDDKTEGLVATDPGVRFDGKQLVKHEEWEDEDMGVNEYVRTFRILKEIGDTIFKCVKFTFDCPSLQPSKGQNEEMVPVLDLKCYVVGEQFVHEYYDKETACKYTIPYSSAHSDKMKMAVLVEDGLRRLRNYSQGLELEKKRLVLASYSMKLKWSRYPVTKRHQVIKTVCLKYDKMCEDDRSEVRPIHRSRSWKGRERRL